MHINAHTHETTETHEKSHGKTHTGKKIRRKHKTQASFIILYAKISHETGQNHVQAVNLNKLLTCDFIPP